MYNFKLIEEWTLLQRSVSYTHLTLFFTFLIFHITQMCIRDSRNTVISPETNSRDSNSRTDSVSICLPTHLRTCEQSRSLWYICVFPLIYIKLFQFFN